MSKKTICSAVEAIKTISPDFASLIDDYCLQALFDVRVSRTSPENFGITVFIPKKEVIRKIAGYDEFDVIETIRACIVVGYYPTPSALVAAQDAYNKLGYLLKATERSSSEVEISNSTGEETSSAKVAKPSGGKFVRSAGRTAFYTFTDASECTAKSGALRKKTARNKTRGGADDGNGAYKRLAINKLHENIRKIGDIERFMLTFVEEVVKIRRLFNDTDPRAARVENMLCWNPIVEYFLLIEPFSETPMIITDGDYGRLISMQSSPSYLQDYMAMQERSSVPQEERVQCERAIQQLRETKLRSTTAAIRAIETAYSANPHKFYNDYARFIARDLTDLNKYQGKFVEFMTDFSDICVYIFHCMRLPIPDLLKPIDMATEGKNKQQFIIDFINSPYLFYVKNVNGGQVKALIEKCIGEMIPINPPESYE